MSNKNTILKISRSKYIEESLDVAIIRLDTMFHTKGTPVMINYYIDSSKNSFDTVFASGVKDGVGRDCFLLPSANPILIAEIPVFIHQRIGKYNLNN